MINSTVKPLTFPTSFKKDESLTSWLIRASFRQFCPIPSFTGYYWPNIQIWAVDIDKGLNQISSKIHSDIAILANTTVEEVTKHTFMDLNSELDISKYINSNLPWTVPLSKRSRYAQLGYHYCPQCMSDDKDAYLSILWRYSWSVCCSKHKTILQNKCPHCSQPYQPHLIETDVCKINHCYFCKRKIDSIYANGNCSRDTLNCQEYLESVYRAKKGFVFGNEVDISSWFETFSFMIKIIRKAALKPQYKFGKLLQTLEIISRKQTIIAASTKLPFDSLPVEERKTLVELAYKLTIIPYSKWLKACEENDFTKNSFHWSKSETIPVTFLPVYEKLHIARRISKKPRAGITQPKPPEVVAREWNRLKRKIEMNKHYDNHQKNSK